METFVSVWQTASYLKMEIILTDRFLRMTAGVTKRIICETNDLSVTERSSYWKKGNGSFACWQELIHLLAWSNNNNILLCSWWSSILLRFFLCDLIIFVFTTLSELNKFCNISYQSIVLKFTSFQVIVSSGLVFLKGTDRLANWADHIRTQEGRQEAMH